MRTSSFFTLVLSVTFFVAVQQPGRAHAGPVEQLVQFAVHPGDPDVMAIRYINGGDGLLYSDDAGATFKLLCLAAVDVAVRRSGTVAFGGDGHLVMGIFDGVYEDAGGGCGWSAEPSLAGIWVSDIAADPTDPGVLYLATSKSDAGGPQPNGLVRRTAEGTYEPFGTQEALLITRVRVVATETGRRIYQSAIMGMVPGMIDGMMLDVPNYVIRVSDDDAETFETFSFGATNGGAFRLVAVDPTDPDRIVTLIDNEGEKDRLLVSADRGETFTDYLELSNFGAIAIAPDGRVFIGESGLSTDPNASVGMWSAANLDTTPEKLADYPVQCLHYQETSDTLFACQRWSFGTVDPDDGAFTETMKFTTVPEFVACDGVDMPATCEAQLCRDYCGPGHFAQAPVCEAYDQPYCGPCVAAMETEGAAECMSGGAGGGGAVDGGVGQAGSGASAGAPGSAGRGGAGEAGSGAAGNGTAGDDDGGDGDGGGCSVSGAGGPPHAHTGAWLAALAAVTWIARKRRRTGG